MSNFLDMPGLIGKFQNMAQRMPQVVEKALNAGASLVVREAQMHHLNGPTSRGSYAVGAGLASVTADESLSRISSRLFRSIGKRVTVSNKEITAEVGSNVAYARIHEYGGLTGRGHRTVMPARPYLRPSVVAQKLAVWNLIRERIMNAYVGKA